jgi:hypothetical protein
MDKFVVITKPTALPIKTTGEGHGGRKFKYNPYPVPKAKERQVEEWRNKKRTER